MVRLGAIAPIIAMVVIGAAGLLPAASNAQDAGANLALTPLRWISADADMQDFLLSSPGECLRAPESGTVRQQVEIGRAAFRNPMLFGGPAARQGLSCASCHRDGHGNDDFFLKGLTDRPGRADVTSALFSKTREDGVFNPLAIPSLVDRARQESFGTAPAHGSLHDFIESAIVEEFQGAATHAVISGLVAYIDHLDSAHCPAGQRQSVSRAISDIRRALIAGQTQMTAGKAETAGFLLLGAQHDLGLINERYAGASLSKERRAVKAYARLLAKWRKGAEQDPQKAARGSEKMLRRLSRLEQKLIRKEAQSLYNEKTLRYALETAPPPRR